jgi:hypothetical protein
MYGLIALVWFPVSTVNDGPVALAARFNATVTLPLIEGVETLVAVTVTVAGAGYGVLYSPVVLMSPVVTDQVTAVLKEPVPFTVATNCC